MTDVEHDSLEAPAAANIHGNEPIPPSEVNPPAAAPPLVRPDRQFAFDNLPHYE
ncbi:MAG: hypothetical protein O3C40_15120 [Planctomycetota bacterium]|nr:hypothetical protein [Planctomycetota bacterium]